MNVKKTALVILDGWGLGDKSKADAVTTAHTPNFDFLMNNYPNTTLKTFGENVGLPHGQMGNSEVGHLNIGAGRIVYQDLLRIDNAMAAGEFDTNAVILRAVDVAKSRGAAIHLIGLVSKGGVHAHQDHLHGLIKSIEAMGTKDIFIHAFTDGRDTAPKNAVECIASLQEFLIGRRSKLVSMVGRYYAMDRDKRWERIKLAYDLLVHGIGTGTNDFAERCAQEYTNGITDEFFAPSIVSPREGRIKKGDVVICFNYRTDRCRQITEALTQTNFPEFGLEKLPLHYVTMTRYDESFQGVEVIFEKDNLKNTLGEVLSQSGCTQLRIAETEKYPHVTFFFSGGREAVFEGESRIVVPSPKVATYDLQPEMSAAEVTKRIIGAMESEKPDFVCLNFANPDMVGHTGVYEALIKAVKVTDNCLGEVLAAGSKAGYAFVIIADHGNADIAFLPDGTPHTAHTTNLVPCIVISDGVKSLVPGILADVAPTILKLMGLPKPTEMTGVALFE